MKTLEDQMSFYAAYHQDKRNKATHFVGVPAIVVSLMIPMGWLRFDLGGVTITLALLVTSLLLAYYLLLDVALGLAMAVVFGLMLWATDPIAQGPKAIGTAWFLALFIGGWALQLWGHVYEGRKPALVDNLFQIFVAPIFLAAELFFALGLKRPLHDAVQKRALEMRAQAGISSDRHSAASAP